MSGNWEALMSAIDSLEKAEHDQAKSQVRKAFASTRDILHRAHSTMNGKGSAELLKKLEEQLHTQELCDLDKAYDSVSNKFVAARLTLASLPSAPEGEADRILEKRGSLPPLPEHEGVATLKDMQFDGESESVQDAQGAVAAATKLAVPSLVVIGHKSDAPPLCAKAEDDSEEDDDDEDDGPSGATVKPVRSTKAVVMSDIDKVSVLECLTACAAGGASFRELAAEVTLHTKAYKRALHRYLQSLQADGMMTITGEGRGTMFHPDEGLDEFLQKMRAACDRAENSS